MPISTIRPGGACGSGRHIEGGGGDLLGVVSLVLTLRMVVCAWMSSSFLASARWIRSSREEV